MSQNVDADSEPGPDPDHRAAGWTVLRPWRMLLQSDDIEEMIGVVRRYGWLPALFGFALHALSRGAFEYVSDPDIIRAGYVFEGWPVALGINLFFGASVVLFSWFLYFGLVGSIAGFFSETTDMTVDVFKFGGYLTVLFAPVFLVAALLLTTVTVPEGTPASFESTEAAAEFAMRANSAVYDTPQMHAVRVLKALVWVLTGFLMLPVVQHLFDIDEKQSVLSVLPVTLVGVLTAFLF